MHHGKKICAMRNTINWNTIYWLLNPFCFWLKLKQKTSVNYIPTKENIGQRGISSPVKFN